METKYELDNLIKFVESYQVSQNKEIALIDGFDEAIIGFDFEQVRVIYSMRKFIQEIEVVYGLYDEDAWEYFAENFYKKNNEPINVTWSYDIFK